MDDDFVLPKIRRVSRPDPDETDTGRRGAEENRRPQGDRGSTNERRPADEPQPKAERRDGTRDPDPQARRPEPDRRPKDDRRPDGRRRTADDGRATDDRGAEGRRPAEESGRRGSQDRAHGSESGRRDRGGSTGEGADAAAPAAEFSKHGPWVSFSGKVLRPPQSTEQRRPSSLPLSIAGGAVIAALALPALLANLGVILIVVLVGFALSRKFGRGHARGRGPEKERPRVSVTTFRVGVLKPDDPGVVARELSCQLITDARRGSVEMSGGDRVTVRGWQGRGGLVEASQVRLKATGATFRSVPGVSARSRTTAVLLLLGLAAALLWIRREFLTVSGLNQSVAGLTSAFSALLVLMATLFGAWLVFKMIFRR